MALFEGNKYGEKNGSMDIKLASMNLSGRFKGREIKTFGERILQKIIIENNIDIFFGQQANFLMRLGEDWEIIRSGKAFLGFDKTVFKAANEKQFRNKLRDLQLLGRLPFNYLPEKNYSVSKLQMRRGFPKKEFIVVSWVTDECIGKHKAISTLKKLTTFINDLSRIEEIPVVLGGTFRLEGEDVIPHLPYDMIPHYYEPANIRRQIRSSNFYLASSSLDLQDIEPVICSKLNLGDDLEKGAIWMNPEDAFYFDPVLATMPVKDKIIEIPEVPKVMLQKTVIEETMVAMTTRKPSIANGKGLEGRRASSMSSLYDEDLIENATLCYIS